MKERFNNTKKRLVKKIIVKNKAMIIGLLIIIILGIVVVPSVFATLQPIKSVEIFSSKSNYSSKEGGSWRVTNSAEFISSNTALVTMDLDTIAKGSSKYKDVVFLLDMSESMLDAKLSTLKSGVINSINTLLSNINNRVGIVSFNNSATLVSNLSNSKSTLASKVNSLTKGTGTSYYQALKQLESMLKSYTNSSTKEFNVVLITDGAPSKDRPNDVALYKYLKDAYPFINISGVQYEAGDKLLEEIKSVSDKQYLTKMDNFSAVLSSIVNSSEYESFSIKERLNSSNFLIESINDIKVDYGSVSLNNNVVTWNLNNISSGSKAKMTLKAKLKNTSNGVYDLNNSIEVNSTIGGVNDALTSLETPVLSNNYKVKYDGNKPSDCTISGVPTDTTHKIFDTVGIASAPKCSGYQFKGWDIVTDNVTKVNDDYFIMPEADVTLKANWSKINIRKSTNGTVSQGLTLYKQVEKDVNESGKYAKKYTGDTSTFTGNNNVYYYYGEAANNNVLFANYCWKIVRTTDTGGVKLLYNGVPSSTGTCNNSWDASALTASQMGTSSNQVAFNTKYQSVADVGYMYNTRYETNVEESRYVSGTALSQYNIYSNSIYIADSYSYSSGSYSLINASSAKLSDNDDTKFIGKYSCLNSSTSCKKLYYIIEPKNKESLYATILESGKGITDPGCEPYLKLSKTIKNNADGTYTLVNPETLFRPDWSSQYSKYRNYYTCETNQDTCDSSLIRKIVEVKSDWYSYYTLNLYKFGNSFTWNGTNYILKDTIDVLDPTIPGMFNTHHYTCFNENGVCNEISYIYSSSYNKKEIDYIKLSGGKGINNAFDEMLYDSNVNKNNSTIKTAVDYWYKNNMTEYTTYLEDTVWCNDRSISEKGGWNSNGGSLEASPSLSFSSFSNSNLTCSNKNDRFTVSSTNGNGALTYPVGLMTLQEINLAWIDNFPLSFGWAYSMTPANFSRYSATVYAIGLSSAENNQVKEGTGIRPAVSLHSGVEYLSGDGSSDHPYVIFTD